MLYLHPRIQKAAGEVHFFDRDENYWKGLEWYRKKMPHSFRGQITIEKSPSYFVMPEVSHNSKRFIYKSHLKYTAPTEFRYTNAAHKARSAIAICAVSWSETLLGENVLHWKIVCSLLSIVNKFIQIRLPLQLSYIFCNVVVKIHFCGFTLGSPKKRSTSVVWFEYAS